MNKLNRAMMKEFYKNNQEAQNKKTYEVEIKRNTFKHGRRFIKYNLFNLKIQ